MIRILMCISVVFALAGFTTQAGATAAPTYALNYTVAVLPEEGVAAIDISTERGTGRLIGLDLDMPADTYRKVAGDGDVVRSGDRVQWLPPRAGGSLRYRVLIDHRRGNGEHDARMTPNWVVVRGDRLFPPAVVRATKGSTSVSRLEFKLPRGWVDVETPFRKLKGGTFAVSNDARKFDRPVGWIAAGKLTTARETIAGTRVILTTPADERMDAAVTLAILRRALPEMRDAFGPLPEKTLIVRSGDPMWRGGLSGPGSLWLHAERPLISANGTSTLLHELVHVFTGIRGGDLDDWISEGIAEFYSLEIGRRSGLITAAKFERAIASAGKSGAQVRTLRASESTQDRTRKAVALFATLDAELREGDPSGLDALTRLLMRRTAIDLAELRRLARKLEGQESGVLAKVK